jgi:hypothetical protein
LDICLNLLFFYAIQTAVARAGDVGEKAWRAMAAIMNQSGVVESPRPTHPKT